MHMAGFYWRNGRIIKLCRVFVRMASLCLFLLLFHSMRRFISLIFFASVFSLQFCFIIIIISTKSNTTNVLAWALNISTNMHTNDKY